MKYHLAIDIGASGGRHILGYIEHGVLQTQEVYRFENKFEKVGQHLIWDIEALTKQVKKGIKKCAEFAVPDTIAIDTWGVDYVLLDQHRQVIPPVHCYRDARTESAVQAVHALIGQEKLYEKTGIQLQNFNTIYQLYCDKQSGKLDAAHYFLMIPAYLSYRLTGTIQNEYTNCTTTGMINARSHDFDEEILAALGLDRSLFPTPLPPATAVGRFTEEMRAYAGFDSTVVFAPSHDTAGAVAGTPLQENSMFISSGTWSLIGTEIQTPITTETARKANFSNEGGIEYRFRFLKNYMGMWLFQNIRKAYQTPISYDEMMHMAMRSDCTLCFDVNAPQLTAPDNMIRAVRTLLGQPQLPIGDVLSAVYHSLAHSYKNAVTELEQITGRSVSALHIVGGGSKDKYLNRLTARITGLPVTAGPVEATAVGNLISQLLYDKECADLTAARELIKKSFNITEVTA